MCDQTEIKYEDEEVVWVKLGACWWPGQVQGYEKLPEDLKIEFDKKGLIAAVKFFQEDKFELVRNLQQIYKYNCKKKDEFLKKGYDKFRSKTKEGSGWMAKFPDDVATAERLTNGDPDILNTPKFSPEEKPDISYLFGGDKKPPKKKKDKDDRKSIGGSSPQRKITHPRFRGQSDYEVRIRTNQYSASSQPSTPDNSVVRNYACPVCSFTSTRVNVLISHVRSHKSAGYESPLSRSRTSLTPKASRTLNLESPKRKYVRKTKSLSVKSTVVNDKSSTSESAKRKYNKSTDNKVVKKKKTDPELREKLLADWDIGSSDEDVDTSLNKSESFGSPVKDDATLSASENNKNDEDLISETDKLLKDTQPVNLKDIDDQLTDGSDQSKVTPTKNKENNLNKKFNDQEKDSNKNQDASKDEKSKFSCFDFDEDEPEPPVTIPVRKLGRVFGDKTSLKKEIIKEFNKSQELENKRDEMNKLNDDNKLLEEMNKTADDVDNLMAKISKTTSLTKSSPKNDFTNFDADNNEKDDNELASKEVSFKSEVSDDLVLSSKSETSDTLILSSRSESDLKSEASGLSDLGPMSSKLGAVASESKNSDSKPKEFHSNVIDQEETAMEIDNNKEEELEIFEIIETEEIEPADKTPKEPKVSPSSPKKAPPIKKSEPPKKHSKAMRYSDMERVTIEEEETLPICRTTGGANKSGNLCNMGWSQLNEIIGSSPVDKNNENQSSKPTPPKRGRGRPPKPKPAAVNSLIKDDPPKAPRTPDSHHERKTSQSESDTERSYSGRRRKPNKKYLEDVYSSPSSSSGFAAKTDDSQSEPEEKKSEPEDKPPVVKKKRGRPLGWRKNKNNKVRPVRPSIDEYEMSDQTLDSAEEIVTESIEVKERIIDPVESISVAHVENDVNKDIKEDECIKNDKSPVHLTNLTSAIEIRSPAIELSQPVASSVDVLTAAAPGDDPSVQVDIDIEDQIGPVAPEAVPVDVEYAQTQDEVDRAALMNDLEDKDDETVVTKERIEILPPKKSQIKKFELSQIDESQIDLENEIKKHVDVEVEVEVPQEEPVTKILEQIDDKPKNDIEEEIEEELEKTDVITETFEIIEDKTEESTEEMSQVETASQENDRVSETVEKSEQEIAPVIDEEIKEFDKVEEEIETELVDNNSKATEPMETIETEETVETVETIETIETIETTGTLELTDNIDKSSELADNNVETIENNTELIADNNTEEFIKNIPEASKESVQLTTEIIHHPEVEKQIKLTNEITESVDNTTELMNPLLDADKGLELLNQAMESVETASEPATLINSESVNVNLESTDVPQKEPVIAAPEPTDISQEEPLTLSETTVDIPIEEPINIASESVQISSESISQEVPTKSTENITELINKVSESLEDRAIKSVSSPSTLLTDEFIESTMPVKKREKPRIIENVQLKEPMHILKSKLLEKPKGKHKLEDHRLGSKPKIIKLDPSIKRPKGGMSYGQKLQVLKAADANDKLQMTQLPSVINQTVEAVGPVETISVAEGQKLIQQSSASLEDMELDINSIPFVLSEDLTPDSIEQMPVVISSMMPASSGVLGGTSVPAQVPLPPRAAPALAPITSDIETITVETSPKKKAPTILKTKPKGKPTITSIKTLSAPLGGIKSLKFQNTKTSPVVGQKNTPSKYVIVQAGAGGQQMRYMIHGKPRVSPKAPVPVSNKPASNPQIVSQGGKVVILTSPQSGQAKMVPLKNSMIKGQNYPATSKITKIDSPTTSKVSPKIVSSSMLGNKSTLPTVGTPKTILNPSLIKPGVYTPVNPAKIINQKTLKPGTLIAGTSTKTILTSLPGKLVSGSMVPGKGTVLTPITGQQVKAIAAKSPGKPNPTTPKVTYQLQKGLSMVTKMQKIAPISQTSTGSPPIRNLKPTGIVMTQKTPLTTKKIIRPVGGSPIASPSVQGVITDKIQVKSPRGRGRTKTIPEIKPSPNKPVKSLPKIKSKELISGAPLSPGTLGIVPQTPPGVVSQSGASVINTSLPVPGLVTPAPAPVSSTPEPLQEVAQTEVKEEKPAPQIMALPTESSDGTQTYVLVTIDDQGQIQPLDNNTLMSLEGTTQNPDGTRTLYIDPGSLSEAGNLDNIVLQFDNSMASGSSSSVTPAPAVTSDYTRQVPTTNQDILAAALANTDFQQDILPETTVAASLTAGLTATSLINQTILQSTIIPTSEPISSPSVLETSLTLNQPIMTPLEVPSSLPIQVNAPETHETVSHSVAPTTSSAGTLELPITITNPGIAYIQSELPGNSMPDIEGIETPAAVTVSSADNYLVIPSISEGGTVSYAVSIPDNVGIDSTAPTPSMPIIDDGFNDEIKVQVQDNQTFEQPPEQDHQDNIEVRDMPIVADETAMEVDAGETIEDQQVQAPVVSEIQQQASEIIQAQVSEVHEQNPQAEVRENEPIEEIKHEIPMVEDVQQIQEQVQEIQESIQQNNQVQEENQVHLVEDVQQHDIQVQEINQQVNYKPESRGEPMEVEESEPSQSYEPSTEIPTQSKCQSIEASPVTYEEAMVDDSEPPTQSYDDVKAEATQSYNAPTQSFSEDHTRIDDPNFPSQSYEVEKSDNVDGEGIIETDGELSQEGNIPSQSNDIDGIGTSFMGDERNSCGIAGTASGTGASSFNEDETASSSYVPETPETQERDQDQESAISTSSYEIPTCEEINIASSSVIPDTSVDAEHTSIHDNGVPEIPTSSYNLNPDSSSGGGVDAVPSSSYEDNQVESVVEQNVSTSYEIPISMPGLEGNAGFVSESTDQADQPTSYYARHTEDTSEATQSYFVPEGPSPSYQPQTASPSYYEPPPESEATQSYYSQDTEQRTADIEPSASQSYYQESTTSSSSGSTLTSSSATTTAAATTTNDEELRLGQVGEATPTYSTERYPVDYNIDNSSPIDRHDLVESSVSATPQPTER